MIHEFDPIIYPRKIWVYIGKNFQEVKDYFQDDAIQNIPENVLGYVQCLNRKTTECGGVLVWFSRKSEMSIDVISHEALHASLEIFNDIGGKVDDQNQECICYLTGWVAKCINEVKMNKVKTE